MDASQVQYGDLVVLDFQRDPNVGFPIQSFSCIEGQHDMRPVLEIAKAFIMDAKMQSARNGAGFPDLRLARVCAKRGTTESVLDFQFQTHALGITPTPVLKDSFVVDSTLLADVAKISAPLPQLPIAPLAPLEA